MCGRFALTIPPELLMELLGLPAPPAVTPRFNIAPTQLVAIVREDAGCRRLDLVRWGLVPRWAKDLSMGAKLINARAETIAEKPSFRDAFRFRRCIVPADGFYEWKSVGGKKVPWFIRPKDGETLLFAGLWERWEAPDRSTIESCTVVTTEANEMMRPLHDRMPVMLSREQADEWLAPDPPSPDSLTGLLLPPPNELLTAYQVRPLVNSVGTDEPACIEPVPVESAPSGQPSLFG